jgi:excisionase family DNA binding protein
MFSLSVSGRERALLNTRDVAEFLGVTARTVRLWAELGEIPALRIGRQWRFRCSDLNDWLGHKSSHLAINHIGKSSNLAFAKAAGGAGGRKF